MITLHWTRLATQGIKLNAAQCFLCGKDNHEKTIPFTVYNLSNALARSGFAVAQFYNFSIQNIRLKTLFST